jgi:DNA-binding transcriptional LysR family regulator
MDRLEAMSLLVTVAEAGSLSAASRKLGVPLPTVSRKISDLEAHLNTRLLTRSTRRLALTDAGAAYVFSPGIFWSGLIVNLWGCEVQALQMNS